MPLAGQIFPMPRSWRTPCAQSRQKRTKFGRSGACSTARKKPRNADFARNSRGYCAEAPVRVELTVADLQSAALATWRRRLNRARNLGNHFRTVKASKPAAKQALRNIDTLCRAVVHDSQWREPADDRLPAAAHGSKSPITPPALQLNNFGRTCRSYPTEPAASSGLKIHAAANRC
jgi:hypothetical protein